MFLFSFQHRSHSSNLPLFSLQHESHDKSVRKKNIIISTVSNILSSFVSVVKMRWYDIEREKSHIIFIYEYIFLFFEIQVIFKKASKPQKRICARAAWLNQKLFHASCFFLHSTRIFFYISLLNSAKKSTEENNKFFFRPNRFFK
jgi:hypothetical protein